MHTPPWVVSSATFAVCKNPRRNFCCCADPAPHWTPRLLRSSRYPQSHQKVTNAPLVDQSLHVVKSPSSRSPGTLCTRKLKHQAWHQRKLTHSDDSAHLHGTTLAPHQKPQSLGNTERDHLVRFIAAFRSILQHHAVQGPKFKVWRLCVGTADESWIAHFPDHIAQTCSLVSPWHETMTADHQHGHDGPELCPFAATSCCLSRSNIVRGALRLLSMTRCLHLREGVCLTRWSHMPLLGDSRLRFCGAFTPSCCSPSISMTRYSLTVPGRKAPRDCLPTERSGRADTLVPFRNGSNMRLGSWPRRLSSFPSKWAASCVPAASPLSLCH